MIKYKNFRQNVIFYDNPKVSNLYVMNETVLCFDCGGFPNFYSINLDFVYDQLEGIIPALETTVCELFFLRMKYVFKIVNKNKSVFACCDYIILESLTHSNLLA